MHKNVIKTSALVLSLSILAFMFFSFSSRRSTTESLAAVYHQPYNACMIDCGNMFSNNPLNALICQNNCLEVENLFPTGCNIIEVQEAATTGSVSIRDIQSSIDLRNNE